MNRRANGEGGAPRWDDARRRWKANYTAADGSRKSVYSSVPGPKGAAECRTKRDAALEVTRAGELPKDTRLTLATWLDTWVDTWVLGAGLSARTVHNYRANARHHVNPVIGSRPLNGPDRLTATDVRRMLNAMAAKGRSATTQQLVFDMVKAALRRAVLDGITTANPADAVDRPTRDTPEFTPWTDSEAAAFLASVEGDRLEALWNTVVLCGLRQGEVLGLRWRDVDLDAGVLTVAGQLDRFTHAWKPRKGRKGRPGRPVVLPMPDRVRDLLRLRETAQKRERLRAGARWAGNDQDLVFTTRHGTPIPHNNIGESWRVRVARVPGLPPVKFHGSRHYAASYQFAGGARLEEVAAFLGHADGSSVTRTYVHLTHRSRTEAAARANALPIPARKVADG